MIAGQHAPEDRECSHPDRESDEDIEQGETGLPLLHGQSSIVTGAAIMRERAREKNVREYA
ncbi:MAG: hypothetical protein IT494_06730 [Gammaproteobacteria bacterium]|nr:hypothetical protein [Gammaproteobacteria bacterium]